MMYACYKKSLYGLKQAPRAWFDRLFVFLINIGFTSSTSDPSIFIFKQNTILVLMLIYVDDIILTSNNHIFIMNLVTKWSTEFSLKDLGALHYVLGVEVQHTYDGFHITMKAKMLEASPISTPWQQARTRTLGKMNM